MNCPKESFSLTITVPDIAEAVEFYVNKWKLFDVMIWVGEGINENAILRALNPEDSPSGFQLCLCLEGARDDENNLKVGGKNVRFSFPKFDFWKWLNEVLIDENMVKDTPWASFVTLKDPFGNICGIHTSLDRESFSSLPK